MIPDFDASGNLPRGIHPASWPEFVDRFGGTPHRKRLLGGLRSALKALKVAGCRKVYLDGSFTTHKPDPGDFDGCWEIAGIDSSRLDPVLLSFENKRAAQKAKYLGEMFPAQIFSEPGKTFLDFFQIDKQTGEPKGIIVLDLEVESCD